MVWYSKNNEFLPTKDWDEKRVSLENYRNFFLAFHHRSGEFLSKKILGCIRDCSSQNARVLLLPTKWCFTTNFENLKHPFQKYLEKGQCRSLNGGCTKMIYGHFIAELPWNIVARFKNASHHISFCIILEANHVSDWLSSSSSRYLQHWNPDICSIG